MVSLQKIFRHTLFSRAYFRCSNLYTRFLFFSLFTFTIVLLLSCGNSDKELNEYNSKALGIEEIKDADINYTLGGNAKAKLRSPLMLRVHRQQAGCFIWKIL